MRVLNLGVNLGTNITVQDKPPQGPPGTASHCMISTPRKEHSAALNRLRCTLGLSPGPFMSWSRAGSRSGKDELRTREVERRCGVTVVSTDNKSGACVWMHMHRWACSAQAALCVCVCVWGGGGSGSETSGLSLRPRQVGSKHDGQVVGSHFIDLAKRTIESDVVETTIHTKGGEGGGRRRRGGEEEYAPGREREGATR